MHDKHDKLSSRKHDKLQTNFAKVSVLVPPKLRHEMFPDTSIGIIGRERGAPLHLTVVTRGAIEFSIIYI